MKKAVTIGVGAMLSALSCSDNRSAGSTDVEVGGSLAGAVQHVSGDPAPGTQVWLYPEDFETPQQIQNAAESYLKMVVAGDSGQFLFDSIPSGTYNLEAYHNGAKTRFLARSVVVVNDIEDIGSQTLHTPGFLRIQASGNLTMGVYYIPGTRHSVSIQEDGLQQAMLDSVPAGSSFDLYYQFSSGGFAPQLLEAGVTLTPGDTLTVDLN